MWSEGNKEDEWPAKIKRISDIMARIRPDLTRCVFCNFKEPLWPEDEQLLHRHIDTARDQMSLPVNLTITVSLLPCVEQLNIQARSPVTT